MTSPRSQSVVTITSPDDYLQNPRTRQGNLYGGATLRIITFNATSLRRWKVNVSEYDVFDWCIIVPMKWFVIAGIIYHHAEKKYETTLPVVSRLVGLPVQVA